MANATVLISEHLTCKAITSLLKGSGHTHWELQHMLKGAPLVGLLNTPVKTDCSAEEGHYRKK